MMKPTTKMALFMKQDFNPPILSRRWIAMKFRPNVLIYTRENIIAILESGLLFREDSLEVEQESPNADIVWKRAGGLAGGWFTSGERTAAVLAVAALIAIAPPKNIHRWTLIRTSTYMLLPVALRALHRSYCRGSIPALLSIMRDYTTLVRRTTACCREYAALHARLGSVTSAVEATHTMLVRQQNDLLILMSRATSALLGNVPWLRGDVVCEYETDNLTKIHHAFLVVQSTLLKYIALAHYMPTAHALNLYKNHNERLYWIYNVLIMHLIHEIKENFEALERMYRLLKNYGTQDNALKKPGLALNDSWLYSEVHTGVAKSCLELKLALEKCSSLDMFLDSCALNKQELDLNILDKDIDDIIDVITKCLSTMENSQIRLKKMQKKVIVDEPKVQSEEIEEETSVLRIEDKEPEIRDEVFYFVKTDDDNVLSPSGDIITGPGQKEKEATKVVLNELKRKLVKREDLMRERERQALAKTMPELKNIPEFPRQINYEEFIEKKGFICKIRSEKPKRLFKNYKISVKRRDKSKYKLKNDKYDDENDIKSDLYEANIKLKAKTKLISIRISNNYVYIVRWYKYIKPTVFSSSLSEISDEISFENNIHEAINNLIEDKNYGNILHQAVNNEVNEARNYKFSKKDLEISSSDSEFELDKAVLLKDVRRHRAVRKKNVPVKRVSIDNIDDSLKPIEYSFGTGMAMASILQVNSKAKMPSMVQEEVFIGDGEVSEDSGNDADA